MRLVAGTILGIVVAFAVVTGLRLLALTLHALPSMAVNDPVAMTAWLQGAPILPLLLYVAAWFVGAFAGGWIASRVAGSAVAVWIVAGLALLLSSATMLQLDFPFWEKIVLLAGPLLGGWLATRLTPAGAAESING